jgi:2'-5' RNA ligase
MTGPAGTAPSSTHRLFVASWPADAWRERYGDVLQRVEWASGGRRIPVGNYHLTLAFLGPVATDRLAAVTAALGRVHAPAFELTFDRIDYWPKPQLLCAVATTLPQAAPGLVGLLWQALVRLGFKQEVRPFKAHLTLARRVERRPSGGALAPVPWPVDRFALVESRSTSEGPVYTPLAFWPLSSSST